MSRSLLLDPLDAVQVVVRAFNESKKTTAALAHADTMLESALNTTTDRVAFLQGLAQKREEGILSERAYRRIMVTTARLLRSRADLVDECQRIVGDATGAT